MRRDLLTTTVIWAAVTAISALATYLWLDPFPTRGSQEAKVVDDAFMTLTYVAAPVFGFVVAVLAYSMLRFRSPGEPAEDGTPVFSGAAVPVAWLVITSALAVALIVHPGLTGLFELRSDEPADMEVNVTGFRWAWIMEYVESGVIVISPGDELVLPAGRRIKFNVTAIEGDVLHSFWVPAFRTKIDAVPGQVHAMYVTIAGTSTPGDISYRVQCAELCGLFHGGMVMDVVVVEAAEFDRWLESKRTSAARVQ